MLSPTEEIKAKLDIIDVISEYFPLKPAGANYKANCPFHQEKTPSFMVNRERQFYHCFGCHESGDVFSFIQKMENIEFPEALKILAHKAGVKLPSYDPKTSSLKTRLLEIHELAREWFSRQLLDSAGRKALVYLKDQRNLSDKTIREWQLGYALDNWEALGRYLKSKNYSDEEIIQSGLVVPKPSRHEYYDRFRDRIMFPIEDYHGRVVGFTGRAMKSEEPAKYINSPQSLVYNKSEVIFGLYLAKAAIKEKDGVVIVEGNMDVITSYQAGVKNVVALSGTALTSEQLKILGRYTNNIIFALDADEAGFRALERSITLAWATEVSVKVAVLDKTLGKDPDEVIQKNPGQWPGLVAGAVPAMDYFFEVYLSDYRPGEIESKKQAAKKILNLIVKLGSRIEEDFYIKKLSEKLDVREESLREAIDRARVNKKEKDRGQSGEEIIKANRPDKKVAIGERLLAYMLMDSDYMEYISENLAVEYLPVELGELYKSIIVYYTKKDQGNEIDDFMHDNCPDLVNKLNSLIILKEGELAELSYNEVIQEIKNHLRSLKADFIKVELRKIGREIELMEQRLLDIDGEETRARLKTLMEEHVRLSAQLR